MYKRQTIDKGLPKYNLDGSMLSYSVKRVSEDGEDEDKFTPDGIGLDAEEDVYKRQAAGRAHQLSGRAAHRVAEAISPGV